MDNSTIEFLREVYKLLPPDKQGALAQVVEDVKFLQAQQFDAPLGEAPASANVKVVKPDTQMEWQVTFRSYSAVSLVDYLPTIEKALQNKGYIAFDAYVDQRRAERGNATAPTQQASASQLAPPPMAGTQPQQQQQQRQETFEATELVATVNNGKAYWKVKGGKYTKFGVTIWPETLQAAGFTSELDPLQVYSLAGFTATVSFKDDKVEKVTSLTRD